MGKSYSEAGVTITITDPACEAGVGVALPQCTQTCLWLKAPDSDFLSHSPSSALLTIERVNRIRFPFK